MQDFMNNGSFTAACFEGVISESKNVFVQFLGMQNKREIYSK